MFAWALLVLHGGLGVVGWTAVAYVSDLFRLRADREFEQMGLHKPGASQRRRFVISTSVANPRRPAGHRRVNDV